MSGLLGLGRLRCSHRPRATLGRITEERLIARGDGLLQLRDLQLELLDAITLRFGEGLLQLEIELYEPLVFERKQAQRLLQRRDIGLVLEALHDRGINKPRGV